MTGSSFQGGPFSEQGVTRLEGGLDLRIAPMTNDTGSASASAKGRKLSLRSFFRRQRPTVLLALGWYAVAIHRGIARYARQTNWALNITMMRHGQLPLNWNGSGIICCLGLNPAVDALIEMSGMPAVNIGNVPHARIPRVSSDNAAVGHMAAEYFLQRGFKNFAFFMRVGSRGETQRMQAFEQKIQAAGYQLNKLDWPSASRELSYDKNEKEIKATAWLAQQLSTLPKPLAVLSEFDDPALEVLDACMAGSISVPEQVAVLGVDNDPLRCEFATVPLSSIDDDQERIGYEAAALLDRMMHGEPRPEQPVLIPPLGVITRRSTDILAIDHPLVASALRTIWEHYTEPIVAKEVAATVPLSYRRLHDAFLHHVGRTIADEITHKRLERAQQLLMETDKKVSEIAQLSGFTNQDRMGKIFRRVLGITPATCRRRFQQQSKDK